MPDLTNDPISAWLNEWFYYPLTATSSCTLTVNLWTTGSDTTNNWTY